jgi:hypothetical protein
MLDHLKSEYNLNKFPNLSLIQANMIDFTLEVRFSLIIVPCNTYSTFYAEARSAMLKCIRQHLEPGGFFAVSMPDPTLLLSLPKTSEPVLEMNFPHPQDGNPVQVSSAWKRSDREITFVWHYDHLLPDGQVDRLTTSARHTIEEPDKYLSELEQAGFNVHSPIGGFDGRPYNPQTSAYLILMAEQTK